MLDTDRLWQRVEKLESMVATMAEEIARLKSGPEMVLFGLGASREYAGRVAAHLGVPLATHHEKEFVDGEVYLRSDVNVRGRDVFVFQSLHGCKKESVNDRLTKLLIFIGALRDASAGRITAVVPYLGYARQDRKVQSREPVSARYMAQKMEAIGVDRVLTVDVHNLSSFQGCYRCRTDHLEAKNLLAAHLYECLTPAELDLKGVTIVSDIGGIDRANRFREALAKMTKRTVLLAPAEKYHGAGDIKCDRIIGDIKGRTVVILDDMISSGSTVEKAAKAVEAGGGKLWGVIATHGLFVGGINDNLAKIPRIVVTDTINRQGVLNNNIKAKTEVVSTTKLVAEAIRRIHEGTGSISDLLTDPIVT